MTPEQFVYWLQGFMEIADPENMDEKQVQVLKDHLALVLKKETPVRKVVASPLLEEAIKNPHILQHPPFQTPHGVLCQCIICTGRGFDPKKSAIIC